ncbi:hypothetical protein L1887_59874 [Cichorium endivia]|nr:hypothetical protein L1887_59874 [Cichorium endivia]
MLSLSLLRTLASPSEPGPEPVALDVGTSGAQVVSMVIFAACGWVQWPGAKVDESTIVVIEADEEAGRC